MADIFRKKSLEKLVSTDQLDRMITIVKPSFWLVFFAATMIVVAALMWAVFGRLPLCVDGTGILKADANNNQTVFCYLSLESAKQVQQGMKVVLQPSADDSQSQTELTAQVVAVEPYVSTREEMQDQLDNETLVEYFLSNGPVVAVECEITKGQQVQLLEGTLLDCSIVLEEKAPFSFLLPLTVGMQTLQGIEGAKH